MCKILITDETQFQLPAGRNSGMFVYYLEKVKSLVKDEALSGAERVFCKNAQFPRKDVNLTYRMKVQSLQLPKS